MTLLEAWNYHKNQKQNLETQVTDLTETNDQLTDMNANLAAQLEASNASRTTPGGYTVDASGPDGEAIDEIVGSAPEA